MRDSSKSVSEGILTPPPRLHFLPVSFPNTLHYPRKMAALRTFQSPPRSNSCSPTHSHPLNPPTGSFPWKSELTFLLPLVSACKGPETFPATQGPALLTSPTPFCPPPRMSLFRGSQMSANQQSTQILRKKQQLIIRK